MKLPNNCRVLIVNNRPSDTGIGRYATCLAKALARNQPISVYQWRGDFYDLMFYRAVKKENYLTLTLEQGLRVISLAKFQLKVPKNFSLYHIANPSLLLISIIVEPVVVTVHDLVPFIETRGIPDHFEKLILTQAKDAERIICVSENTRKDLIRFVDVGPEKVRVIYNGVDHELFRFRDKLEARRKLGLPLDNPIVLNVGSEEPRKNIPTLLRSFKKLLNDVPNALLVRVGERTAQTEKLIRIFGLDGKTMYRRASPSEIGLYYNAADLLVHPAYYEGFGNPPLEAMASALPVIAGNRTCYSSDTYAVTLEGLKRYDELKVGDLVWTLNTETGVIEANPIEKIYVYEYKGEMFHLNGRNFDLLITPEHRLLVKDRYSDRFKFVKPSDLSWGLKVPITCNWDGTSSPHEIYLGSKPRGMRHRRRNWIERISFNHLLELIGWYIAEGSLEKDRKGKHSIRVTLSVPKNDPYRLEVESILKEIGIPFENKQDCIRFQCYPLVRYFTECGASVKEKRIPRWILNLDKESLKILFYALVKGDGYRSVNGNFTVYATSSPRLAIDFCELCLKLGFSPRIFRAPPSSKGKIGNRVIKSSESFRIHIRYKNIRGSIEPKKQLRKVHYSGKVWCVSVRNKNLLVFRNGRFMFSGNSIPEVVGNAGILLDPFDVDGFAYWMREVLTNEDLRAKLSEAGYKRSLGFSWEKCAMETLEVYREVLDEA